VKVLGGHDGFHPYFDPTAFAAVKTATFGTAERGAIRGPGFFTLNTSLSRTFTFAERYKLQFRAEAFNITNTPHFDNPGNNISAESGSNLNGFATINSSGNERSLRLAGRFSF